MVKYGDYYGMYDFTKIVDFNYLASDEIDHDKLAGDNLHFESMMYKLCEMGKSEVARELNILRNSKVLSGDVQIYLEYVIGHEYERQENIKMYIDVKNKSIDTEFKVRLDPITAKIVSLYNRIPQLQADPGLIDILEDMLSLMSGEIQ